ncbi:hypothetical protein F4804DRAFT_326461 [Jackrogersella minutella]|nr:hypothetical protein F4804DRAFT_326461 [Jackrogersella minutella]
MRRDKSRIAALNTLRQYLRRLYMIYRKYTGKDLERRLRDHLLAVAKLEHTRLFGLRIESKHKKVLDPSGFTYLAHFRWVRDWRTSFRIGSMILSFATFLCGRAAVGTSWCMPNRRIRRGRSRNMRKSPMLTPMWMNHTLTSCDANPSAFP